MLAKAPKKTRGRKAAAPKEPTFTIDIAGTDEESFREIFDLLLAEHDEAGIGALNPEKTAEACFRTLEQGMTLIARDRKGKAIGTMGIAETTFWYGDAPYLQDVWFYVAPKNRRNTVGTMLLKAARAIADVREMMLFVTIANPNRRQKKTPMGLIAQQAGYLPVGYSLRMA
jgi:GNAT superfamily N-acetyltransferase